MFKRKPLVPGTFWVYNQIYIAKIIAVEGDSVVIEKHMDYCAPFGKHDKIHSWQTELTTVYRLRYCGAPISQEFVDAYLQSLERV